MPRVYGSPFRIDFTDKEAVIAYARRLGTGQTVYKHPQRPNFNITHTERTDLYQPEWVIHQT